MFDLDLLLTIVRVLIGALFIGHGAQKLFGWFGGYGLSGTGQFMGSMGFTPGSFWAAMAGISEFVGGAMVALGFLTPIGAAMIFGVMVMAIIQVHGAKGLWNAEGGSEYNLVIMALMLLFGLAEPTRYSVDAALGYPIAQSLLFWGTLMAVAIGLAISLATRTRTTTSAG